MVRLSFYEMSRVGESITETGRSLVASLVARSGGSGMERDGDGESESEVTQSCPTVCDPMDCSLSGFSIHGFFFFFRQEYWSGLRFPSPGDLPDPGIKPPSSAIAGKFDTPEPSGSPIYALHCIQ